MKPKRLPALGVLLVAVTAAASLTGPQKSALPQPTEQQKLKERVDTLESQLKEAQAKADRSAFEKGRIDKIQQHYEDYYEKVLSTQTTSLTILGITLTAVFALAGLFSLKVFDDRTKNAIATALTQLEAKLSEKTQAEAEKLRNENNAQVKQLEDNLVNRIADLEKDTYVRSEFEFQFAKALAADADERYPDARESYRLALSDNKSGRARDLFKKTAAERTLVNLFFTFEEEDRSNYTAKAEEELTHELYNGLEDELARAALKLDWLGPLVNERKQAPPSTPKE